MGLIYYLYQLIRTKLRPLKQRLLPQVIPTLQLYILTGRSIAVPPISLLIKKTLSTDGVISLLQELKKDDQWATKAYIYITFIYFIKIRLFNQVVLPLINQESFLLRQLVKKKVAIIIFAGYHLRNFILKILYQRSLRPYRKIMRLFGYYREKVRLLRPCRNQTRSLRPYSWGVTLSWGVLLVIIILYHSLIDLPLLMKSRQALTSKSFLIQEDIFTRKELPQVISTKRIQSRF